ncbi:flagellar hook protein FlgE [Acetivibrio saccincola]|uniref:Flagellar hook protein FlgE n=1 Tax=Acetivibrio saccincola TaxID=1677857 RepID=A0A2S8RDK8_9FIRM|nr:flagellar hook protein FlgE [Acetivibrio saccincola]PQQ67861.1 flagellar biosynthesis protein FlgE [Acetivibrio saccincola]
MMRSMFSGVSGLRTHQTRMDVIGNNIANVNTVAFKSGRVTFQEVFNQTLSGASAPDATTGRGGTNPMQVGLGIGIGTIDTITTRGSIERTDNPTDLSIEGDGFFIVRGGSSDTFRFTRAGNFGIDKHGNLVTGNGMNVYGWQAYEREADGTYTFDTENPIEPINLFSDSHNGNKRMIAARATTSAVFVGNLDSSYPAIDPGDRDDTNIQFMVPVTVYDSLGNDYKININFWKESVAGGETTWYWEIPSSGDLDTAASGSIRFDSKGQIIKDNEDEVFPLITIEPDESVGSEPIEIKLDFSGLTMYSGDSSVKPISVDGYSTGSLVTFSIGSDGIITGIYSNGQQQPLGLIALASFENPAGLQKVGNNMYLPTTNSGDFTKAVRAGMGSVGTLNPGTLEMSNVDLSREFSDMIITQRGFQANSRIITTSDEMLQELVNLKR